MLPTAGIAGEALRQKWLTLVGVVDSIEHAIAFRRRETSMRLTHLSIDHSDLLDRIDNARKHFYRAMQVPKRQGITPAGRITCCQRPGSAACAADCPRQTL